MPRRSHLLRGEEEHREDITRKFAIYLPPPMAAFLEVEAKRIGEEKGKYVRPADVVRALITAYYEKRMAGLLVSPDD